MRGKEARGATPPVAKIAQPNIQATDSSPSTALPKPLSTVPPAHPEQDLQELISSFSDSIPAPTETAKEAKNDPIKTPIAAQRIPTGPSSLSKSQVLSLGSPKIASKLSTNGNTTGNNLTKHNGGRHTKRRGSLSDMSEGEILEEPLATRLKPKPPVDDKQTDGVQKIAKTIESRRQSRDDTLPKPPAREQQADSSSHKVPPPTNPKAQIQRNHEERDDRRDDRRPERRDSFESRPDRRPVQSEQRFERNHYLEQDKRSYSRRDSRDEDYRRAELKAEPKVEQKIEPKVEPKREEKARVPTLEQLLPHDNDVREWLEITGYHNVDYRSKILERRRKIAILDAQREQLIAEMAAEEGGMRAPTQSMAPPPAPPKPEPSVLAASAGGAQRDLPVANKRTYSEMEPRKDSGGPDKMPRLEDRAQRVKDDDLDGRRPNSRGGDTNQTFGGRRDQRDDRFDEDRRQGRRSQSRDLGDSPGRRAYESRPAARRADDDMRDYEGTRNPYSGRGYDSNSPASRGRGRAGRGRGGGSGYQDHIPYNARGANGKSFKDHGGGYDKGRNDGL